MNYRALVFIALALVGSSAVHGQDMIKLKIDNVSFEENGLSSVYDDQNHEVIRYDRFENKNIQLVNIKNTRIYNGQSELLMTIVVNIDPNSLQLHLQNKEKQRGRVDLVSSVGFGTMKTKVKIDYFGKPFTMNHETDIGQGKVTIRKELFFDGKLILSSKSSMAAEGATADILIDRSYLAAHQEDAGIWAMLFYMLTELGK